MFKDAKRVRPGETTLTAAGGKPRRDQGTGERDCVPRRRESVLDRIARFKGEALADDDARAEALEADRLFRTDVDDSQNSDIECQHKSIGQEPICAAQEDALSKPGHLVTLSICTALIPFLREELI